MNAQVCALLHPHSRRERSVCAGEVSQLREAARLPTRPPCTAEHAG